MIDKDGYIIEKHRVIWYAEIGQVDGFGIGRWENTLESYRFPTKEQAEHYFIENAHRFNKMSWGELRLKSNAYSTTRVRRRTEIVHD